MELLTFCCFGFYLPPIVPFFITVTGSLTLAFAAAAAGCLTG